MTYFYYPAEKLLKGDDILDAILPSANKKVLVDTIDKDGLYVWNERNCELWEPDNDDDYELDDPTFGCTAPYRIQQFINKKVVNDVYFRAEELPLIPLYSTKEVLDNNHPSDEALLKPKHYVYIPDRDVHSSGIGYEYRGDKSDFGELCVCVLNWMNDWNTGYYRNEMIQIDSNRHSCRNPDGTYSDGLYFTYIAPPEGCWDNFQTENYREFNEVFWVNKGRIVVKASASDIEEDPLVYEIYKKYGL